MALDLEIRRKLCAEGNPGYQSDRPMLIRLFGEGLPRVFKFEKINLDKPVSPTPIWDGFMRYFLYPIFYVIACVVIFFQEDFPKIFQRRRRF